MVPSFSMPAQFMVTLYSPSFVLNPSITRWNVQSSFSSHVNGASRTVCSPHGPQSSQAARSPPRMSSPVTRKKVSKAESQESNWTTCCDDGGRIKL